MCVFLLSFFTLIAGILILSSIVGALCLLFSTLGRKNYLSYRYRYMYCMCPLQSLFICWPIVQANKALAPTRQASIQCLIQHSYIKNKVRKNNKNITYFSISSIVSRSFLCIPFTKANSSFRHWTSNFKCAINCNKHTDQNHILRDEQSHNFLQRCVL